MQATLTSYFVLHTAELITGAEKANVIFITYNLYYAGDSMLHTLFVMKYWGLSRKISYAISGVPDPAFDCKYYTLLNQLMSLIIATVSYNTFYMVTRNSGADFNHLFDWMLSAPPCIVTVILAEALWRLRNYKGDQYSISKTQIFV